MFENHEPNDELRENFNNKSSACRRKVWTYSLVVGTIVALFALLLYLFLRKGCIYDKDTCNELYDQGYEAGKRDQSKVLVKNNNKNNNSSAMSRIGSSLVAGSTGILLYPGFNLETKTHVLKFQYDGNLVISNCETGALLSTSRTYGNAERQAVRGEFSQRGTLRLWNSQGKEIWAIVPNEPGDVLTISKEGKLEILKSSTDTPVWVNSLDSVSLKM